MRIVVIDDNIDSADTFKQLATMNGHDCKAFYCGQDAFDLPVDWADLLVTDMRLPHMSGHEVIKHLKEKGWTSVVIVHSGMNPLLAKPLLHNLADHFFLKPTPFDEIMQQADQLLQSRKQKIE